MVTTFWVSPAANLTVRVVVPSRSAASPVATSRSTVSPPAAGAASESVTSRSVPSVALYVAEANATDVRLGLIVTVAWDGVPTSKPDGFWSSKVTVSAPSAIPSAVRSTVTDAVRWPAVNVAVLVVNPPTSAAVPDPPTTSTTSTVSPPVASTGTATVNVTVSPSSSV